MLLRQNEPVDTLSGIQESGLEDNKQTVSKLKRGDKPETPGTNPGDNLKALNKASHRNTGDQSRRHLESAEQVQARRQTRNTQGQLRSRQENPEQLEQRKQARRKADRQHRQRQAHFDSLRQSLHQFKSDLLIQLEHCAVCNCIAFTDKTKKVSNTTLLGICPEFQPQPQHTTDSVLCSKCKTQTSKGSWPSWVTNNHLSPDDIPIELASLSSDQIRLVSLICPFLKVIILPGGQFGEEGSVIHFPFPVQHIMSQLPHPLNESELILSAVSVAQRETLQNLLQQIDDQQVYRALLWLRQNNPLYASIPMPTTNQSISIPMSPNDIHVQESDHNDDS